MWGDEDELECRYVFAHVGTAPSPSLVVASPTPTGWRVRSTARAYQHDYVSGETFPDVMGWMDAELGRPLLARDREEAREILRNNRSCTGFLLPGECASEDEEAERVLRHLETGW